MQQRKELNKIQLHIMRSLYLKDGQRFAELNTGITTNDHFSYHLRKLIKDEYIYKNDEGIYHLSTKGKTSVLFLDIRGDKYISQGLRACRVVLKRVIEGKEQFLIQRRTKVPFIGYLAEPGGKIQWGETVVASAQRNMYEQTGFVCDMVIKGQIHILEQYENEIVQDKYFYVLEATILDGELRDSGPTGSNHWMTEDEIYSDPKAHQGIREIHEIVSKDDYTFVEVVHTAHEY